MAHAATHPDEVPFRTWADAPRGVRLLPVLLVALGALTVALLFGSEPHRAWEALLFNWLFWTSLALGMTLFAVALHLTNAHWAWSVQRFAAGGVAFLPIALVLLPFVFGGSEHFFHHWLHAEGDPVLEAKRAWLNLPGLIARDVAAVALLTALALWFVRTLVRPDLRGPGVPTSPLYERLTRNWRGEREEALRAKRTMNRLGPVLAILYAVLWGMIGVDLAMSLEPHWFSTMFPVAFFWTGFHGGVAATALAVCLLRRPLGLEPYIGRAQLHDLGKLVFAFSIFWMYLNWSQYIVIWYGLLPVEQSWLVHRLELPFGRVAAAVVLLTFVLPFFGLLTKPPKRHPLTLGLFATSILVGHWLERYLLVVPSLTQTRDHLPLGWPELGVGAGFAGLFLAAYLAYLRRFPLLPSVASLAARDPLVVAVPTPEPERAQA